MKKKRRLFWWVVKALGLLLTPVMFVAALLMFVWEALENYDD